MLQASINDIQDNLSVPFSSGSVLKRNIFSVVNQISIAFSSLFIGISLETNITLDWIYGKDVLSVPFSSGSVLKLVYTVEYTSHSVVFQFPFHRDQS